MGWLWSAHQSRKNLIRHLVQGNGLKTIACCVRGTCLWAVQETRDGERFIALYIVHGGWNSTGYKDMTESSGPYEVTCPLAYLDLVPEPASDIDTEMASFSDAQINVVTYLDRGLGRMMSADLVRQAGLHTGDDATSDPVLVRAIIRAQMDEPHGFRLGGTDAQWAEYDERRKSLVTTVLAAVDAGRISKVYWG